MRRAFFIILCVQFFVWILPLGVFIKSSQEAKACGGQRAICLCTHGSTSKHSKPIEGVVLKSNADASPKESAGGAGGSYYDTALILKSIHAGQNSSIFYDDTLKQSLICRMIDHVPKV